MNEKALSDAIKNSSEIRIGGGGTRGGGDFGAPSGVVKYSPDELLMTVNTGTSMDELCAILDEKNQMIAQEPMNHRVILGTNGVPTIGGALGMNADGPRRLRYGSLRDATLGVRFIDGRGEVIRAGGEVMKNVTGLDVTKFFVGSTGQLGLALDASLKLMPKPFEVVTTSFEISLDEFSQGGLRALREPLEITGAVYVDGKYYIRQEGQLLAPLVKSLQDFLGQGQAEDNAIWADLRDWRFMSEYEELWRIYVRPTQAASMAKLMDKGFMILSGGAQLVVAATESEILPILQDGQFAICEKGALRGKRIPAHNLLQEKLRADLKSVFDPEQKFGGINAH